MTTSAISSAGSVLTVAALARLEVGGERLAAFLDHAGDVLRELLDVDRAGLSAARAAASGVAAVCRWCVFCTRFLPVAGFLEDYGPWFRHINGINLFEAILTDTLFVVHCGVTLPANDVERTTIRLAPRAASRCVRRSRLPRCGSTIDMLPEKLGGLPSSAPQRPAQTMPFPNVYEPRPKREATPLTDDEQKKLESELLACARTKTSAPTRRLRRRHRRRLQKSRSRQEVRREEAAAKRQPATAEEAAEDEAPN